MQRVVYIIYNGKKLTLPDNNTANVIKLRR